MSTITLTELYALLTEKVGKEAAEKLTTYIESKIDKEVEHSTKHLSTKEDLVKGLSEVENKLTQKIYWTSLIQILTIIGSIIAMFKLFK